LLQIINIGKAFEGFMKFGKMALNAQSRKEDFKRFF